MARAVLVIGLALVFTGCGGEAQDRERTPAKAPHPRVLTASDVDVLPGRSAGFPGGSVACEVQVRRMLLRQARHGRTPADREGARIMLRELGTAGDFQSGCSSIVIPVRRR